MHKRRMKHRADSTGDIQNQMERPPAPEPNTFKSWLLLSRLFGPLLLLTRRGCWGWWRRRFLFLSLLAALFLLGGCFDSWSWRRNGLDGWSCLFACLTFLRFGWGRCLD